MNRIQQYLSWVLAVVLVILTLRIPVFADNHNYTMEVNVTQNVVTVFDNGQPVKAMTCSSGSGSPHSGTYRTSAKYRWLTLFGNVYGQYCTRITGHILFHSVPYTRSGDASSLEYWEYDKLGTTASMGCIRLCVEDAKWIYDNCSLSTSVTFVTGDSMPLGKPETYKLSEAPESFRGWDPTDPDGNNPWRIAKDPSVFDSDYYADKYEDLRNAYGYSHQKLFVHYVLHGIHEGRQASSEFDIKYYKENYADLIRAFGEDDYAYVYHYLDTGRAQGRRAVAKPVDPAYCEAFATRLYQKCLGREPEAEGLAHWKEVLVNRERNGSQVARSFVFSEEYKSRNTEDEDYVEMLYQVFLDRASDTGGKAHWLQLLDQGVSREYVFQRFSQSKEYGDICDAYGISRGYIAVTQERDQNPSLTAYVNRMYREALGRAGEEEGLNHWCKTIRVGAGTPEQVAERFINSQEFRNKNLSDEEYVKVLYRTFMGREYDEEGLGHWLSEMSQGSSREEILHRFAVSREFRDIQATFGL